MDLNKKDMIKGIIGQILEIVNIILNSKNQKLYMVK